MSVHDRVILKHPVPNEAIFIQRCVNKTAIYVDNVI